MLKLNSQNAMVKTSQNLSTYAKTSFRDQRSFVKRHKEQNTVNSKLYDYFTPQSLCQVFSGLVSTLHGMIPINSQRITII